MNKRVFRDIKSNFGRYFALFILTMIAVGMFVGFISGTNSAKDTFSDYLKDNNLEDGYFTLDGPLDEGIKGDVEELGVDVYPSLYADKDNEDGSTVRIFNERTSCNIPYVGEGILPQNEDEIFLDQLYAKEKKLKIGNSISIGGKSYKISGTGAFPDYTISLETPSQMLADRSEFGVAMVSEDAFKDINEGDISYNYAFIFKDNLTEDEKKEKVRDIVKTLACVSMIENYGKLDQAFEKMSNASGINAYSYTESNKRISGVIPKMDSNKSMATMFVGVVVIIIAFLYVIFSKQVIQQECSVLGTLIALGIRKTGIIISYLIAPCLITLLGSVVGVILGMKVLYVLPINSLSGYYSIPECSVNVGNEILVISILLPCLLIGIINTVSLIKNLNRKPLQLIRKDLKKNRGAKNSHFNAGSFDLRFRVRMFMRSIGVYVLLFVGILLGGLLMMFGVGMSSSFDRYIDEQSENALVKYQYAVSDEYKVSTDEAEEATVSSFDYYSDVLKQSYSITGVGVSDNSQFFKNFPKLQYKEIAISDAASKKFNINKNDQIELQNTATGEKESYKVVEILNYNLGLCIFTDKKEMNNILRKEKDYHNYYFSNKELDIPEDNLVSKLTVDDYVSNGKVMKNAMKSMIMMFPAVAVIVYLIIMYILIKLIISQNEIGISMLKIFGFTEKEIRKMYTRTNLIVTVLIILISLPLQYSLMVAVWPACIKTIPGYIGFVMGWKSILLVAGVGLACYLIANFTSLRRVKNVPMVMALKNQDS
ncbi:ABC transporter permease [Eubacterium sp.]|uniref:ABC transporter permease n=1 Tax=Eubacterium sp. TaxID=142586 RepID=UPI002586F55A|nr:ABC transporter permease [Eubacterium sp.]MCR5367789.1 ABC transporter permease [Eubacterium sp.]